jgi:5-methylcytosine-specific restriction enzyme A
LATFIVNWNPRRWDPDGVEHRRAVTRFRRRESVPSQWSVGRKRKGIEAGDRVFLLRQHKNRGLVASGRFSGGIFQETHWDGSGRDANYAPIVWDAVIPVTDCLPIHELKQRVSPFPWDRLQASGVRLPDSLDQAMEDLWREHLRDLGIDPRSNPDRMVSARREGAVERVATRSHQCPSPVRQAA